VRDIGHTKLNGNIGDIPMGILSAAAKAARAAKKAKKKNPKPKFKAERKLDEDVEKRLVEQDKAIKAADKAKDKGDKPKAAAKTREGKAFEQTQAEKAKDKAPKAKEDTRVGRAGAAVTAAERKAIADAPSPQALTTLKSKLNNKIEGLKNATAEEKKARKAKIADMISGRKDAMRKKAADAAKPKKPDTRPAAKKKQTAEERQRASIGKESAIGSSATGRKAPMAAQRSGTDIAEGKKLTDLQKEIRQLAGKADKSEAEVARLAKLRKDLRELRLKRESEVVMQGARRSGGRKPVSLPAAPKGAEPERGAAKGLFKRGGLTQPTADQTGLKKLPTPVRNKMGYMKRGGKVTKGHTDMRKGGLFY